MAKSLNWAGVAALFLLPATAFAAEPVRQIGIYVRPFYEAARTSGERPEVAVGKQFNGLLSSNRREDILAARDLMVAKPGLVTPMTRWCLPSGCAMSACATMLCSGSTLPRNASLFCPKLSM